MTGEPTGAAPLGLSRGAWDWIDGLRSNARTGTFIDPRSSERLFRDVAEEWRGTWADLEPKTRAGYESILRRHLIGTGEPPAKFHAAPLSAVSTDVVQRFVNELVEKKAPNTVRRMYGVIRSVMAVAVERRYIATNTCDAVRLPRKGRGQCEMVFLDASEVRTLADAIDPHWRFAVFFAAYTGMRAGEQWALRRRDIDVLRGTVTVHRALKDIGGNLEFGSTKTHQRRTIILPKTLRGVLNDHLATPTPCGNTPEALVFTTPTGTPVRQTNFHRREFAAARKALPPGKQGCRWHDLRHTCAALSIESGAYPQLIMARLGHEDIKTTLNVYGHLFPSLEASLADALDAHLAPAVPADAGEVVALR